MSLKRNILTSIMIAGSITAAIVTPIAVMTTTQNSNQDNVLNANVNKSSINSNSNTTFNILSTENSSYNNYLNTEFNINKINKDVMLSMINQKISNINSKTSKNNSFVEIQNNANLLKNKTNEIIQELYSGKVTIKNLLNEIYNNYNKMPESIKTTINNSIQMNKIQNKKILQSKIDAFISMQPIDMISGSSNFYNTVKNTTSNMLTLNSISTSAAAAATVVAAAVWAIPFYGWVAEGAATAGVAADWISVGISWAQYAKLNSLGENIVNGLLEEVSIYSSISDVFDFAKTTFSFFVNSGNVVLASILADLGVQDATAWADPEVDAWYIPAISAIQLALDSTMAITGILGM